MTMVTSCNEVRNLVRSFVYLQKHLRGRGLSHSSSFSHSEDSDPLKEKIHHCLINAGISDNACVQISSQIDPLHVNLHELSSCLQTWNACQFGPARLSNLLETHPGLLQRSPNDIRNTFTHLSSIFSPSYVYKILLNSPRVVRQKKSEIDDKLNFLNNLGISNSHIVDSSCLDYSLTHIRVRSEFLKRCGVFKVVTKKDLEVKNPQLSDMFDSSDQQFAVKVAKLTLPEYEAFALLYSLELEDEDEYDSE